LNWNMAEKVVASKDPLTNARSGLPKTPGGTSVSSLFTWLGTGGDYSKIGKRDQALTGWRRQFSTSTSEGRLNVTVGTFIVAGLSGLYLYKIYRDSKTIQHIHFGRTIKRNCGNLHCCWSFWTLLV